MTQPPPPGPGGHYPGPGPGYGPPPAYPPYQQPPPYYPGYGQPALSPGGLPLADFGSRLAAYLIDGAILAAISAVIMVPLFWLLFAVLTPRLLEATDPYAPEPDPSTFFTDFLGPILLIEAGIFLLLLAIYYVYFVELMWRSGQTLGKKAMKLRVVPLDPAGKLTRGSAAARYLVQFIAGSFVPFLGLLDGLWQLWDKPLQQCLHDKAANTVVVKVPS